MTSEIRPGLLVLHGNRLELLTEAVFDWLGRTPLAPLEPEHFLVQSNGAAEWLKMSLARRTGLCAATQVELPARLLWRVYRQMLGRTAVPTRSALEKDTLTWRLMRLLPACLDRPGYEPVAGFLQADGPDRWLQLASRLADLYDQYQVYRADWLGAWQAGRDVLIGPGGREQPLPADQRWQALLWREAMAELSPAEQLTTRPQVHQAFLAALARGQAPVQALPRRLVLFGAAHLSGQALEALAALSSQAQVLLAIPNPCRYHWADILDGRELLRAAQPRHGLRGGLALGPLPLAQMHQHAHPLLAAWGRQGRDFMRQLDAFDDAQRSRRQFDIPRIDLFDDGPGLGLLGALQASIRDLLPLAEHPLQPADPADRSIVFHIGHSAQREVEILHDQLLALLAAPPGGQALAPRDMVVMVPDVEVFAPAIRAVFGQYGRDDARHIPFDIADLQARSSNPMVVALAWLLRAPAQRYGVSALRDLLDVPAIARRFGLAAEALPGLAAWIAGAGVRWGLHAEQRASLGLGACGGQNSWHFGLDRMLLGYAAGAAPEFEGITPFDEIGGLDAAAVGSLASLVRCLGDWWALSAAATTPRAWAARGRALLAACFEPTDERERITLAAMQAALSGWLEACDDARFDAAVPLSVLREAWLAGLDSSAGSGRFLAGGVTFCTLMPLRAIPFEVVCLLGMNDGDYPRQAHRNDFDLMGQAGQQRPGDRSRRDDDRYLMLEAVLSARRLLYVSWAGRSARDNTEQPPSVLVSQLRDYLVAAWPPALADPTDPANRQPADEVLRQRSTVHPLQPFSRRYFEGGHLFTHAREWRAAHLPATLAGAEAPLPPFDAARISLAIEPLVRFLRNPVKAFFKTRLDVVFDEADDAIDDDEAFALQGLDAYAALAQLLAAASAALATAAGGGGLASAEAVLKQALARLQGAGRLPIGHLGAQAADGLCQAALPMLAQWQATLQALPQVLPPQPLRFEHAGLALADWLSGLRSAGGVPVWPSWTASRLLLAKPARGQPLVRPERLIEAWVRGLAAAACGEPAGAVIVGADATVTLQPLAPEAAQTQLRGLIGAWQAGMAAALPVAARTALAWAASPASAEAVYDGGFDADGEGREPCLARIYPDFAALSEDGRFAALAEQLYAPLLSWAASHASVQRHAADDADAAAGADDA